MYHQINGFEIIRSVQQLEKSNIFDSQYAFVVICAQNCNPCERFCNILNYNNKDLINILDEKGINKRLIVELPDSYASDTKQLSDKLEVKSVPQWRIYREGKIIATGTGEVKWEYIQKRLSNLHKFSFKLS